MPLDVLIVASCLATSHAQTPPDLIGAGLYDKLAIPFVSGEAHRRVSHALLAKKLGAQVSRGGGVARLSSRRGSASLAA